MNPQCSFTVALLVVLVCALGLQAVTADTTESVSRTAEGTYPGATLISVQDYRYDGGSSE
ncbi:hypothetical protein BRC64_11095 [Halobacteriales archaeon QH_10_67_22]|nr:MAG: hypothetical protein BRC64_11095 [Halobacteriales archaeon QH_10_67_22]